MFSLKSLYSFPKDYRAAKKTPLFNIRRSLNKFAGNFLSFFLYFFLSQPPLLNCVIYDMALSLPESIHKSVQWTRIAVLVLAITIVAFSLTVYSSHTTPIFSLFGEKHSVQRDTTFLLEMVQDRRLISTLVAAQASVFCPLFLLLSSSNHQTQQLKRTTTSSSSFLADLICCHILMPCGLTLSWVFCLMFDRKTMDVLSSTSQLLQQQPSELSLWWPFQDMCLLDRSNDSNYWPCMVVNTMHGFKYLIVCVLLLEIELVLAGVIYMRFCQPQIQLPTDDAEEKGTRTFSS